MMKPQKINFICSNCMGRGFVAPKTVSEAVAQDRCPLCEGSGFDFASYEEQVLDWFKYCQTEIVNWTVRLEGHEIKPRQAIVGLACAIMSSGNKQWDREHSKSLSEWLDTELQKSSKRSNRQSTNSKP